MDLYEAIFQRRSIRRFQSKPVPREVLEKVLEAALWAPSAQNLQNWYFVVLGGQKKAELLALLQVEFTKSLLALQDSASQTNAKYTDWFIQAAFEAPLLIAAFSDSPSSLNPDAPLSVAAAVQNLLLAAWSEGLGSCWFTRNLYAIKDVIFAKLGIRDKELVGLVVLGYPAEAPPAPPRREGRVEWRLGL